MEFKIGDKVKILKNEGGSINDVGDVGVITRVGLKDCQVQVNNKQSTGNWHWKDELILAEDIDKSLELKEAVVKLQSQMERLAKLVEDSNESDNKTFTYEDYKNLVNEAEEFVDNELDNNHVVGGYFVFIDFKVNKDKKTVVALAKIAGNSSVVGRGIAKCMKNELFQEDIGKAIALGRLLGRDVSKFTNI